MANSPRSKQAKAPKKILGSETPRLFTPPLRPLTPKTSAGFSVIEFAEDILGIELKRWQKWFLEHALELLPNGEFRFRTVVLLVSRQNGKSTLYAILTLWMMYVRDVRTVLGMAQNLQTAEKQWRDVVEIAQAIDELDEQVDKVYNTNGKIALVLDTGARYTIFAPEGKQGRGESADLVIVDELREHLKWDAWNAVSSTTLARDKGLTLCASNAGTPASIVLNQLRLTGHVALGDPDGDVKASLKDGETLSADEALGLFEWSATPGCDHTDVNEWAKANPAMGELISERALRAEMKKGETNFRIENLCQTLNVSVNSVFEEGDWEATLDHDSRIPDEAELSWSVDLNFARTHAHIAVAGIRADGEKHAEIVASRPGTGWLVKWFTDRIPAYGHMNVVIANGSPIKSELEALSAIDGVTVIVMTGPENGPATGNFYDLIVQGKFHRPDQPMLDVAATNAVTTPYGATWAFDRAKSWPIDVSPIIAAMQAVWHTNQQPEPKKVSAYESHGLVSF